MNTFGIFIIMGTLFVGVWGGLAYRKWRKRRSLSTHRSQGRRGEENAEMWLSNYGFEQLESQNEQTFTYSVNNTPHSFKVRPDLMARYQGQRWLIEVKTGKSASPSHSATRRQIREYAQLWPHLRYGLFDASEGVLHEISFKARAQFNLKGFISRAQTPFAVLMLSLGLIIGGVGGLCVGLILNQG